MAGEFISQYLLQPAKLLLWANNCCGKNLTLFQGFIVVNIALQAFTCQSGISLGIIIWITADMEGNGFSRRYSLNLIARNNAVAL